METKRYKPLVDGFWLGIIIPIIAVMLAAIVLIIIFDPMGLWIMIPTFLFVLYFLISPFFGCVELRKESVYIKYGFFIKREIPYKRIRDVAMTSGFYSESMLSLKCAREHVNIKYNTFDITCVSVVSNDEFVAELRQRCGICN